MLIIPPGRRCLYKDFELDIPEALHLVTAQRYLILGANGSGKTSFIRHILIPALWEDPERQYILYVEQQMRGQLLALKAHAVYDDYQDQVNDEAGAVDYLLFDLRRCLQRQRRPVMLIIDESAAAQPLRDHWAANADSSCLLEVSHRDPDGQEDWNLIEVTLQHPGGARMVAK